MLLMRRGIEEEDGILIPRGTIPWHMKAGGNLASKEVSRVWIESPILQCADIEYLQMLT